MHAALEHTVRVYRWNDQNWFSACWRVKHPGTEPCALAQIATVLTYAMTNELDRWPKHCLSTAAIKNDKSAHIPIIAGVGGGCDRIHPCVLSLWPKQKDDTNRKFVSKFAHPHRFVIQWAIAIRGGSQLCAIKITNRIKRRAHRQQNGTQIETENKLYRGYESIGGSGWATVVQQQRITERKQMSRNKKKVNRIRANAAHQKKKINWITNWIENIYSALGYWFVTKPSDTNRIQHKRWRSRSHTKYKAQTLSWVVSIWIIPFCIMTIRFLRVYDVRIHEKSPLTYALADRRTVYWTPACARYFLPSNIKWLLLSRNVFVFVRCSVFTHGQIYRWLSGERSMSARLPGPFVVDKTVSYSGRLQFAMIDSQFNSNAECLSNEHWKLMDAGSPMPGSICLCVHSNVCVNITAKDTMCILWVKIFAMHNCSHCHIILLYRPYKNNGF